MEHYKYLILLFYYDRPIVVKNALNSLNNLNYKNFEIAFIDDGSTVPGKPIAESVLNREVLDRTTFYNTCHTVEQKKLQGGSIFGKIANEVVYSSNADYVIMLCDDDALYPNFLVSFNTFVNSKNPNRRPYYYSHIVLYDALKESYLDGVKRNNLLHFTNRYTQPINCTCAVDASQVVYSRKDFVKDNLLYPFPQTRDLDAAIYQQMYKNWGPAHYSGLISQVKCWNADNLGARPKDKEYITDDML